MIFIHLVCSNPLQKLKCDAQTAATHSHDRNHNIQQLHVFIDTDIVIWNHNTAMHPIMPKNPSKEWNMMYKLDFVSTFLEVIIITFLPLILLRIATSCSALSRWQQT